MRIVFDCERMKYPYTGLYEYCHRLGLSLQKVIAKEDDITYYVPKREKHVFDGYKSIAHKSWHKLFPLSFKADILHINFQLSRYMGNDKKVKKLLTIHDLNFLYENKSAAQIKLYLKALQRNIDKADYLVAISNYTKQDVLKHLDTQGKPFDVIYNGCDIVSYDDFDDPHYRPTSKFIFAIGTVLPKKNFHVLPRLLVGNDYELIIAGKGDPLYIHKVKKEAMKYNVQDRVKILGSVSSEDKYWYMTNCLAFTQPSLAEGFGIPVIEAMHLGKPTFLSTNTALPEIGGDAAYYFEDFVPEHIQAVFEAGLADYSLNNRAAYITEYASKFSWDKCAEEYYKIYQKLLKR